MAANNPYKSYLKQEIEGATKGKLVLLLYDGAIKFLRVAKRAIEKKDIQESHNNIIKAENILFELMSTLDMDAGGDIATNLLRLYDFMIWQLIDANKTKDAEKVESVIKLMSDLRDAWKTIVDKEEKEAGEGEKKSINFAG